MIKTVTRLIIALLLCAPAAAYADHITIGLTPAQHEFIVKHPSFNLCVDPHLLPFEEIDERGEYRGLFADLLAQIAAKARIELRAVPSRDYSESRRMFESGQCDLLTSSRPGSREESTLESQAFYTSELGYMVNSHAQTVPFAEMAGGRIGVVNGTDTSDLLVDYPQLSVTHVDTLHIGMEGVVSGELQSLIAPLSVLDYHNKESSNGHLISGGALGSHTHYVILAHPQHQELIPILNKAIVAIGEVERANAIHKWLHQGVVKQNDVYYLVLLLISLLILLLVYYRARYHQRKSQQLQNVLADSEARFHRLADSIPDMLFRMSLPEGRYEYVSPAATAIFGYTPHEFLQTPKMIQKIASAEWGDTLQKRWERMVQGENTGGCEFQVIHKSGEMRWISQRCSIIKDADGRAVALEGIVSDITERKKIDEALQQSEYRLRGLIESSPDWVWEVDAHGVYTYASPKIRDLLGYTPEEVVGKTPFDLMEPAEAQRVGQIFGAIVSEKRPFYNLENTNRHKEGHRVVLETSGTPIIAATGELLGYRGVDRDISQRKANEHELRVERDFINTVVETAGNIFAVIDTYGRLVRFNRAAEVLTGYSREEVIGRSVWEVVIPDEQIEKVKEVFENLRAGKIHLASEYENQWKVRNGDRKLLHWYNTVLFDEAGKVEYIVALGYDVTDKSEAEKERQRLQRELQQAQKMESLGQLTGGIAHDFNNLLGIINGYGGLVLDGCNQQGNVKLAGYMEHLMAAGKRAANLVSQMLAFSRVDPSNDMPIELAPLVKEDAKLLRATLPSTIEMTVKVEADLPPVIMNPTHLHQILMNLCINARDAMSGVGRLELCLRLTRGLDTESTVSHKPIIGDWIELSVTDSGSGIDPATMEMIFNPFFTTKEVGKGTGMGLSVVYSIMNSHKGHILVESEVGKGSTFRLLFPPCPVETKVMSPGATCPGEKCGGAGQEIVIVDDEESLALFMAELLKEYGYRAITTQKGSEALHLISENPSRFSLLITDQTMPHMSGLELIEQVRQLRPGFPAILCSGYSDKVDAQQAEKLNLPFFEKPVDDERLVATVGELIGAWCKQVEMGDV